MSDLQEEILAVTEAGHELNLRTAMSAGVMVEMRSQRDGTHWTAQRYVPGDLIDSKVEGALAFTIRDLRESLERAMEDDDA